MNKAEKILYKKIENNYSSTSSTKIEFTQEDYYIIDRWISIGILNKDAFYDSTAYKDKHKIYLQNLGYPFTPFGESEYKKGWYSQLRNSKVAVTIVSLFMLLSFIATLLLTILQILKYL